MLKDAFESSVRIII